MKEGGDLDISHLAGSWEGPGAGPRFSGRVENDWWASTADAAIHWVCNHARCFSWARTTSFVACRFRRLPTLLVMPGCSGHLFLGEHVSEAAPHISESVLIFHGRFEFKSGTRTAPPNP